MKLKHIGFNRVRSDQGFVVTLRAFRGFVRYREGDHIALIPVNPVAGQALVQISERTPVVWEDPYRSESVDEQKRQRIIANIIEALKFRKCQVHLLREGANDV